MELLIGSNLGPAPAAQGSPQSPPQGGAWVAVRQRYLEKEERKNQQGKWEGEEELGRLKRQSVGGRRGQLGAWAGLC